LEIQTSAQLQQSEVNLQPRSHKETGL